MVQPGLNFSLSTAQSEIILSPRTSICFKFLIFALNESRLPNLRSSKSSRLLFNSFSAFDNVEVFLILEVKYSSASVKMILKCLSKAFTYPLNVPLTQFAWRIRTRTRFFVVMHFHNNEKGPFRIFSAIISKTHLFAFALSNALLSNFALFLGNKRSGSPSGKSIRAFEILSSRGAVLSGMIVTGSTFERRAAMGLNELDVKSMQVD
mmetsp:Transcript_18403/g.23880  ORF Transcript_18403/g.23880 Transcript_18403/m.23880 type:complete len:207 (-) Transcript_18403:533-1153(-)